MLFYTAIDVVSVSNKKYIHINYLISFLAIKCVLYNMAANKKKEVTTVKVNLPPTPRG